MADLFASPASHVVQVQLPLAIEAPYDYLVPDELSVEPGDFVIVPLGPARRLGIVWGPPRDLRDAEVDESKLKAIISVMDAPRLPQASRDFAEWVARYNLMPLGAVARMLMSAPQVFEPQKPRFGVKRVGPDPSRLTPARKKLLEIMDRDRVWPKGALAEQAGVSNAVIDGLVKSGTLVALELPKTRFARPDPDFAQTDFTSAQAAAADRLKAVAATQSYNVALLDGVTGSGKTEVYFEAVSEAIRRGAQVLILLPEIALTSGFMSRFEKRFGVQPASWHSSLTGSERGRIWRAVAEGDARIVVGARSALFLPFPKLGLIVVDEEHDTSFKQEERGIYHGRDMAVVRASLVKSPIILASATPSLESLVNARQGRYQHIELKERFTGRDLPPVAPIDMREHPPEKGSWLSPVLIDEVTATIARGEQALLFLNRRGYAPLTLCRNCGLRFDCPQCSAWLVEHRFRNKLQCHHCGFSTPVPKSCPKCQAQDSLVPCGPGIERVCEEVRDRFPDAKISVLSSDLAPNVAALKEILREIEEGEAEIIIGTQLVAKGHNFPKLTLVGVIDGDLGTSLGGDPRAAERTFQLLHQVTGRAGRAALPGRGLVQTHAPEHPVIQALISGNREDFIEHEIAGRHGAGLPPFGRLVSLIVSARNRDLAAQFARELALCAPPAKTIDLLGPAEAPIAVIRGRYRFRLLLKAPKETDVQSYVRGWLSNGPAPKGDLKLSVDIDPYNFL